MILPKILIKKLILILSTFLSLIFIAFCENSFSKTFTPYFFSRKDDDGYPPPAPPGFTAGEGSHNQQSAEASNTDASSQQPRRLVINENKDRHFIDQGWML